MVAAGCGGGGASGEPGGTGTGDASAADGSGISGDAGTSEHDAGPGDASAGDAHLASDAATSDASDASPSDAADAAPFTSAPHSPWPTVINQGGPVLKDVQLVLLVPSNHPDAQQLLAFAPAVPQSTWWSTVSSVYGLGTMTATAAQGPAMTGALGGVSTYVQAAITKGTIPGPTDHNLYLLFAPPAVTGQCATEYGYHDTWPTGGASAGDVLGVVEYCTPDPQDPSQLDELTHVATHEIAEGSTNPQWGSQPAWVMDQPTSQPWTQSPWWSVPCGELADMCNYEYEVEGGFSYQRIWSNAAAKAAGDPCIPAAAGAFYDVSSVGQPDWTPVTAGEAVDLPLHGWSTGPQPPWWQLDTYMTSSSSGLAASTVSITSPKEGWFGSCPHEPIADNAGPAGEVQLHVTAAVGAKSGDWAVFEIDSYRQDVSATCTATPGTDARHFWFVGVYVK
jgi:hypothetical protein